MTPVDAPRMLARVASTLADRIEEIARRKGWSLRKLGSEAGLKNPNHVSVIVSRVREKPGADIETDTLRKLARAGGVSAAWLAGESEIVEGEATATLGSLSASGQGHVRYPNLDAAIALARGKVPDNVLEGARSAALKSDHDLEIEQWLAQIKYIAGLERKLDADLAAGKDIRPKLDEAAAREEDPPEDVEPSKPAAAGKKGPKGKKTR